jgi:hypothetical protein
MALVDIGDFLHLEALIPWIFQIGKDCNNANVGVSVDEQTFSILYFMKSKLRNYLNEHLQIVVWIYSQTFYILNTTCFDDWKEKKSKWVLN